MSNSPTILVVDDSPFAAKALVHVLESRGLRARAASTMAEAMNICAEFHPSVLVTDVRMPDIDLFELCRQFRAAASDQRSAVLLFSAHAEVEIDDLLAAIRADALMEKRHGAAAVAARVEALCTEVAGGQSHPSAPAPG